MLYMSKSQQGIWKIEFTEVPVNSDGVFFSSDVISTICPFKNDLVARIVYNNKSVPLQPVTKVAVRFQEFQVLFHADAALVFKKVLVDLIVFLGESDIVM